MPVNALSSVVSLNTQKLFNIFKDRKDSDYTAVPDVRYNDINRNAVVAKGVNVGEVGEILPLNVGKDRQILVRVDLSYAPGENIALEILPCADDCLNIRKRTQDHRDIAVENDRAHAKYPALYQAAENFNSGEIVESKIAS